MIETLRIKNLILIDECMIEFSSGLTIITGETGAGKTALTQALELLKGERSDSALLRKGEDKALVEGCFNIQSQKHLLSLLDEIGIEYDLCEPLILTRELSKEGRSRAFINRQAVPLSTLQKIGSSLICMIGQHSYHELKHPEALRDLLDTYGMLEKEVEAFKQSLKEHQKTLCALEATEHQLQDKERNAERYQMDLDELINAKLQEDEEEELFRRYSFATQSQQIRASVDEISRSLSYGPRPMLKELSSYRSSCERLSASHKDFSDIALLFNEAITALQEIGHMLGKIASSIDEDGAAIDTLEKRLSLYTKIKKKYGATYSEWMAHKQMIENTLSRYEDLDEEKERLKNLHTITLNTLENAALVLSEARKSAAERMADQLCQSLNDLNMNGAKVQIDVKKQSRTTEGDDHITFWLQANKGEKPASTKDSTSGGELSRLLLAIKTLLAEKNNTATIIFDEIDANVGGTTATLIGAKLRDLSHHRQVFCITHFAQVAKSADQHIRVSKEEKEGRTVAHIQVLDNKGKSSELLRMMGENHSAPTK